MEIKRTRSPVVLLEHGNKAQEMKSPHTNPFPEDLYTNLRQDHPDLPVELPKFESHHANLSLRRQLMEKLPILTRKARNFKDDNYKLQWKCQNKVASVKKAIDWIEAWGAAEKQQRDTAKQAGKVLPSVGRPSSRVPEGPKQSMKESSNPEQKTEQQDKRQKMPVLGRARKEGITVIVTIIYKNLNDIPEKEFDHADQGVKVVFEKLPFSTKLSAILQSLGATDPTSDFLDFTLNPKDIGRSKSGAPINFPLNMRRIGWGGAFHDSRQVRLFDMLSHVKEGTEDPVLKCKLARKWEAVKTFNTPDKVIFLLIVRFVSREKR